VIAFAAIFVEIRLRDDDGVKLAPGPSPVEQLVLADHFVSE